MERSQLIGKAFARFLQPSSRDPWRFYCQAIVKSGQMQECDLELNRKDKAQMVVRLRSQPVKDEKEEVVQWRTTMTNVTARYMRTRGVSLTEAQSLKLGV